MVDDFSPHASSTKEEAWGDFYHAEVSRPSLLQELVDLLYDVACLVAKWGATFLHHTGKPLFALEEILQVGNHVQADASAQALRHFLINSPKIIEDGLDAALETRELRQSLSLWMVVLPTDEGECHFLAHPLALFLHTIVGLIMKVKVTDPLVVCLLHLFLCHRQQVVGDVGIALVLAPETEGGSYPRRVKLVVPMREMGIVQTVKLTGGEVTEREVGVEVDAVVAHRRAQKISQHLNPGVERDIASLVLRGERDGEEVGEGDVSQLATLGLCDEQYALLRHVGERNPRPPIMPFLRLQQADRYLAMTHQLGTFLAGEL